MKDTLYIAGKRQPVASLEAAIAALKAGKVVVVVDSAGVPAEITPKQYRRTRVSHKRLLPNRKAVR